MKNSVVRSTPVIALFMSFAAPPCLFAGNGVGSHGYVGLTLDNAEAIFAWAPMKTRAVVLEEEPDE